MGGVEAFGKQSCEIIKHKNTSLRDKGKLVQKERYHNLD